MMDPTLRPRRSALYLPGSKPRAIDKARSLATDVLILDLEDSVLPDEKAEARLRVAEAVSAGLFRPREVVIRVNAAGTAWAHDDLAAVRQCNPDAVLLPKVETPEGVVDAARSVGPDTAVWAMIETPRGILAAPAIAGVAQMGCLVAGTNDLAAELQAHPDASRAQIAYALQQIVLAARASGIAALDGVFNAYKDADGLAAESRHGKALGYDGKTLIHPGQIPVANAIFGPEPDQLAQASRILEAFEEAERAGQGVGVLDGKIVENLHVAAARRLLAQQTAIEDLEREPAQ